MIKPLDKPKKGKASFIPKLVLLTLLLSGAVVFHFVQKQPSNSSNNVLGTEKSIYDTSIPELKTTVQDTSQNILDHSLQLAQDTGNSALDQVTSAVSALASQSADTVSNLFVDTTASTIKNQIEKLPQNEQDKLKQALCK